VNSLPFCLRFHSFQNECFTQDPSTAFIKVIVEFMFSGECGIDRYDTPEAGLFKFRVDDVVAFYGVEKAAKLAVGVSVAIRREGMRCTKDAAGFVKASILLAVANNKDSRVIYKKRKHRARIEYNFLQSSLFGNFNNKGTNTYWS
jgi:hypothetical protein